MLYLLFQLGEDRYALDAAQVIEVLPLIDIKQIPQAPSGVAGICNRRSSPLPVIDLNELTLGPPAARRLSTRIIVVRCADGAGGMRELGLIAERATGMFRREPADFVDAGITNGRAPYLGPVTTDERGLVQRIEVERLLPESVRAVLFTPSVAER
jgi:chemotaxis-related protein WspB